MFYCIVCGKIIENMTGISLCPRCDSPNEYLKYLTWKIFWLYVKGLIREEDYE